MHDIPVSGKLTTVRKLPGLWIHFRLLYKTLAGGGGIRELRNKQINKILIINYLLRTKK